MENNKVIFSGVQPTGNIHIGNYFGAIKSFKNFQNDSKAIFCIVDSHAITIDYEADKLFENILNITAFYLASGLDPKKAIIFKQSSVDAHHHIMWILSCIARYGWLNRMTQFKDKVGKNKEKASVGLYIYPILMASDILTYKATHVPVGEDQIQHLELTRDIAIKFNQTFNDFFPIPEVMLNKDVMRIMSLKDGAKKMSKSDPSDLSRININDSDEEILRKIKKAKTDNDVIRADIKNLEERKEVKNLLSIASFIEKKSLIDFCTEWEGKNFSQFKPYLADLLINELSPIRKEYENLLHDKSQLIEILKDGSKKASDIANKNLLEIKKIMGFADF